MRQSIARIALTVFLIVFLPSFFMPVDGNLSFYYAFTSISALIITGAGRGKMRITGAICLILSLYITYIEYEAGKNYLSYRERAKKSRNAAQLERGK